MICFQQLKESLISNSKEYIYESYILPFCNVKTKINYYNLVNQNQDIFKELKAVTSDDKYTFEVDIIILENSNIFNQYELIKNKHIEYEDFEMVILPYVRVYIHKKTNEVLIVAKDFFILRELYSILPYLYYKKEIYKMQPLILHACAINYIGNFAYIFIGKSGAGKTTTAQLANKHGLKVLSDELICIYWKPTLGTYTVVGTKITSENSNLVLATEKEYIISNFCILEKKDSFEVVPYKNIDIKQLLSQSVENSILSQDLLLSIYKLCNKVPFIKMGFLKNKIDWEYLQEYTREIRDCQYG